MSDQDRDGQNMRRRDFLCVLGRGVVVLAASHSVAGCAGGEGTKPLSTGKITIFPNPVNPALGSLPSITFDFPPGSACTDHVDITLASSVVQVGKTDQATATAKAKNNNSISGATFTWQSSNNTVATVNANGTLTGVQAGTTYITATETTTGKKSLPVAVMVTWAGTYKGTFAGDSSTTCNDKQGGNLTLVIADSGSFTYTAVTADGLHSASGTGTVASDGTLNGSDTESLSGGGYKTTIFKGNLMSNNGTVTGSGNRTTTGQTGGGNTIACSGGWTVTRQY